MTSKMGERENTKSSTSGNDTQRPNLEQTPNFNQKPNLVPPDGGYGWAVVFGNALLMFVNGSIMYCFGVVYVYLIHSGYSNTEVAIVPAMMNAFSNLLAPIATALSRYYSHRRISIIGSFTISCGLFLCSLSNHIIWFYICYGTIIGIGNSMVHSQGFLLCQKYFHHKRVAANGASMLGGSFGFMTVPLLLTYFANEYSYKGAFILWSGITLHGLIGATLFQPVQWHMKPSKKIPLQVLTSAMRASEDTYKENNQITSDDNQQADSINSPDDSKQEIDSETAIANANQETSDNIPDPDTFEGRKKLLKRNSHRRSRTSSHGNSINAVFGNTDGVDGFGSTLSVKIENMKIDEEENEKRNQVVKPADYCLCCGITWPRIGDIINFSLFKYPAFLTSSFSSICNRMVYMCFVTYLPSIVLDIGIEKNSSYLFSCVAIFELIAKIVIAAISDRGFMQRRYFIVISSIGSCLSILSATFVGSFWSIALCCCCYGFCVGTQMTVGPVLLVEYLGIKLLPYSYGLMLFLNGVGGLLIFFLTGILNDMAGNYTTTYWGLSILSLMPSIAWSLINKCPNVDANSDEMSSA